MTKSIPEQTVSGRSRDEVTDKAVRQYGMDQGRFLLSQCEVPVRHEFQIALVETALLFKPLVVRAVKKKSCPE